MIDREQIYKWWSIFHNEGEITEIRSFGGTTFSGYYKDIDNAIRDIEILESKPDQQIYFITNAIREDCYGRAQRERLIMKPKNTTNDEEIVGRKWIMIDLDPKRASGVNSSNQELEFAHKKAVAVYKFLRDNGFNEPVVCMSGNGYHLMYACRIGVSQETDLLIERFINALAMLFTDEYVDVDKKCKNRARLSKVYGTTAKKGANSEDRPWRTSCIVKAPDEIKINDIEYIKKIANLYPEDKPAPSSDNNWGQGRFDIESFLQKHNIGYKKETYKDGTKYVLEHCCFNENHKGKDAVIFQRDNGALSYVCLHNSCSHYTFKDFRLKYDPTAYDKKDYREFQFKQRYYGGRHVEPYTPIAENDDKGKKWLSMKDVKRVDISELLSIPTGYHELDKKIIGLFAGELSVLSGLNACVDCDTEYFNGSEWKKISEYSYGDKVLQYNEDGTANLVYPQRYIKEPCEMLHLIKTKFGVNQCLSDEHNVVYMTSKGNLAKKNMKDLIAQHNGSKHGFNGRFYTTFKYSGRGIDLTDEQIRVMCAVICDGTFKNGFSDKSIVRLNLKKERKKERLEKLLNDANIEYRKEQYNPKDLGYNNYIFKSPRTDKEFGAFWYDCTAHQLSVIADEIIYWDGCLSHNSYSSTNKKNIDFIQFAFASIGKRTSIYTDDRVGKKHSNNVYEYKNICYDLNICSNNMVSMINVKNKTQIKEYKTLDGYKYCFTVPSGMLVLRRGGNINITGNSGKTSWLDCLALNVIQKGFKVAIWSGEMQDWRFQGWINQMAAGKNYVRKKHGYENFYYTPRDVCDKIDEWVDGKLFLYNNSYGSRWEQLFNDVKEIVDSEGVQLVVLDNLSALCIDGYDSGVYANQTKFILDLKGYAKQKNIHVILVAHPRKQNDFLRKESISGTADLTNIADNVFLIHRVGKDFEKRAGEFFGEDKIGDYLNYSNIIEVAKNRQLGIVDHLVGMYYEMESRRLKNSVAEYVVYGWDSGNDVNVYTDNLNLSNTSFNDAIDELDYCPF